jgi:hypothetical protein
MSKFAKLFEVKENEQVLVSIQPYNDEDEFYGLEVSTEVDGAMATATLGFETEKQQIKGFDTYTIEQAIKYRESVEKMLTE